MDPPLFVDRSEPDVPEADHEDVVGGEAAEELRQNPHRHLPVVVDFCHLLQNIKIPSEWINNTWFREHQQQELE